MLTFKTALAALLAIGATAGQFTTAENLLAAGDYRSALSTLDAVPAASRDAGWHLLASRAYDGLDRPSEAVEGAQKAIELDPRNQAAYLQLSQIFLTRNTPEAAQEILSDAQKLFPNSVLVKLGLGLALKDLRAYEDAAQVLTQCLQLDPALGPAFDALGTVYLDSGRYDDLERAATDYLQKSPSDFRGYYYLAATKQKLRANNADIEALLNRCLELNPRFAAGHALLGKVLLDSGKLEPAVASLERAIQLRPGYAPAHLYLAGAYRRLGRSGDAQRESAELARLNEEQGKPVPKLLYHRGAATSHQ